MEKKQKSAENGSDYLAITENLLNSPLQYGADFKRLQLRK